MMRQAFLGKVAFQRWLVGIFACLVLLPALYTLRVSAAEPLASQGTDPLPEIHLHLGKQEYTLEHATTPQQCADGLMNRTSLAKDHGMLFSLSSSGPVAFWMKNTLIPLDMLFLQQGKVVYIQDNAPPCTPKQAATRPSCPAYTPGAAVPVDAVIELPGGTAKAHKLHVGLIIPELARAAAFSAATSPFLNPTKGLSRSFSGTGSVETDSLEKGRFH